MHRSARMLGLEYIGEKLALTAPWEALHERDNVRANASLLGAGAGAALGAGLYARSRPGVRAAMGHAGEAASEFAKNLLQPGRAAVLDAARVKGGLSPQAQEAVAAQAKAIADQVRAKGLDPATARIAVAGLGGSGKGTLAKALSAELGIDAVELDELTKGLRPMSNTLEETFGDASNNMLRPGMIADQKRVMSELDPDMFDAVIRLDRDPSRINEQLINRGRGAWQADLLDNGRSQRVLNKAFDASGGEALDMGDGVAMKFRPEEGFGLGAALDADLGRMGIKADGMSQFEKLQKTVDPSGPALKGVAGEVNWDELSRLGGAVGGIGAVGGSAGYVAGNHS